MSSDSSPQLIKSQERAAQRSAAAFRRAAKHVAEERKAREAAGLAEFADIRQIFPNITEFSPVDPNSEIVSRAMDLIKPVTMPEPDFRRVIATFMDWIRTNQTANSIPNMGRVKSQIEHVAHALRKTIKAIAELPRPARVQQSIQYWDDFCGLLQGVLQTVELHHKLFEVNKGGRQPDLAKVNAAEGAAYLIINIQHGTPSKTIGGAFYELASVLYEGGTGISGADLQRFCRNAVLASHE